MYMYMYMYMYMCPEFALTCQVLVGSTLSTLLHELLVFIRYSDPSASPDTALGKPVASLPG